MTQGLYWSLARHQFRWWCWNVNGSDLTKEAIISMGKSTLSHQFAWSRLASSSRNLRNVCGSFVLSTSLLGINMEGRVTIGTCSSLWLVKRGWWLSMTLNPLFKQSWLDRWYSEKAETAEAGLALHAVSLVFTNAMVSVIGLVWIPSVLKASRWMSKSAIAFRSTSWMTSYV